MDHIREIAMWIYQNCGTDYQPEQMAGSIPSGTRTPSKPASKPEPVAEARVYPLLKPIGFNNLAALPQIQKKILESNAQLSDPQTQLTPSEITFFKEMLTIVKDVNRYHITTFAPEHVSVISKLTVWPEDVRFACMYFYLISISFLHSK
jgi:hypothetical protein